LRYLSRQVQLAQEDERKRISRELHDVIVQTLTGINIHLALLKKEGSGNAKVFDRKIARTQQLVEKSVDIVHRFALELHLAVLDDLGLIPALNTFMKGFKEETGIHVSLSAFAGVEQVNGERRIVLYRVVQVRIQKRNDAICMKIIDNGKGFQVEPVLRAKEVK
jgi:signal transduction histidine kinase